MVWFENSFFLVKHQISGCQSKWKVEIVLAGKFGCCFCTCSFQSDHSGHDPIYLTKPLCVYPYFCT